MSGRTMPQPPDPVPARPHTAQGALRITWIVHAGPGSAQGAHEKVRPEEEMRPRKRRPGDGATNHRVQAPPEAGSGQETDPPSSVHKEHSPADTLISYSRPPEP